MTFLFDIGHVLLDFDFSPSLTGLFPADAVDREQRLALLLERKDEFEAGGIDTETYIAWALETLGSESTPAEFRHAWQQIFTPNEPMWKCVRQLAAAGHRLILFSNINGIHWPWITENYLEFALFHESVVSFQTGFIKPQPQIYQYAIDRHALVPAETIYIDDLPPNIATGRALGFRCWQYDIADHEPFEQWLSEQLILNSRPSTP